MLLYIMVTSVYILVHFLMIFVVVFGTNIKILDLNLHLTNFISEFCPDGIQTILISSNSSDFTSIFGDQFDDIFRSLGHRYIINVENFAPSVGKSDYFCQCYILINTVVDDLIKCIETLKLFESWNTRSEYLVVFQGVISEKEVKAAFTYLWKNNIFKTTVYCNSSDVFNWSPYAPQSKCGQQIALKRVKHKPTKYPTKFSMCPFNVTWSKTSALARDPFDTDNRGMLIEVVYNIGKMLDAKFEFLRDNVDFNLVFKAGQSFLAVDDIKRRNIQLAVVGNSADPAFNELERTFQVANADPLIFVLPPRKLLSNANRLLSIYTGATGLLILLSFCTSAVLWSLLSGESLIEGCFAQIRICFQSLENPPPPNLKIIFPFFLVYNMLLNAIYSTYLSSIMTSPGYEGKIRTLEDLAESKIPTKVYFGNRPLLEQFQLNIINISNAATTLELLKELRKNPDHALITPEMQLNLLRNPECVEKIANDWVSTLHYSLLCKKGLAILEEMNKAILTIRESGLPSKWLKDTFKVLENIQMTTPDNYESKSLNLGQIVLAFEVYAAGISISFAQFIFEIYWFNLKCKL